MNEPKEQAFDQPMIIDELVGSMYPEASVFDKDWIAQNITTILKATADGEHQTMYYPACGTDLIRPLLAYNLDSIIAVDNNEEVLKSVLSTLDKLGVNPVVNTVGDNAKELVFEMWGKNRKILLVIDDARILTPLIPERTDILHIYFPTGADRELENYFSKPGENTWRINPTLDAVNITRINVGGFLVINEMPIVSERGLVSASLLEIAGIDQIEITKRHPQYVMTSFYPDSNELHGMNRNGAIFHKKKEVAAGVLREVQEGIEMCNWADYILMEIERGNFEFLGNLDYVYELKKATLEFVQGYLKDCEKIIAEMKHDGVDLTLANSYGNDFAKRLLSSIKRIQSNFIGFIRTYDDLVFGIPTGKKEFDDTDLLSVGIILDQETSSYRSNIWPIALPYLQKEEIRQWVLEFSKLDIDKMFTDEELA